MRFFFIVIAFTGSWSSDGFFSEFLTTTPWIVRVCPGTPLLSFTVEALVSGDHLGNSDKMVVTRAGRLQEYALVSDPMVKQ